MTPLAFERKQTKDDAGTAFRLRMRAVLGQPQPLRKPAIGNERPGGKPSQIVRATLPFKLSVEVAHKPVKHK